MFTYNKSFTWHCNEHDSNKSGDSYLLPKICLALSSCYIIVVLKGYFHHVSLALCSDLQECTEHFFETCLSRILFHKENRVGE